MKQKIHEWTAEKWQEVIDDINVRIDRGYVIISVARNGYLEATVVNTTIIKTQGS